jgi:hypothetical protein
LKLDKLKKFKIMPIIPILPEYLLLIIPSLDNMKYRSGKTYARRSRHIYIPLPLRIDIASNKKYFKPK